MKVNESEMTSKKVIYQKKNCNYNKDEEMASTKTDGQQGKSTKNLNLQENLNT